MSNTNTKISKIQALADRGIGGERDNARSIINKMMHGSIYEISRYDNAQAIVSCSTELVTSIKDWEDQSFRVVAYVEGQKKTLDSLLWYPVTDGDIEVYNSSQEANTYYLKRVNPTFYFGDLEEQFLGAIQTDLKAEYGKEDYYHELFCKGIMVKITPFCKALDFPFDIVKLEATEFWQHGIEANKSLLR